MEQLVRTSITDAVVDYVRQKIQNGEWESGEKLPSERYLMLHLGISRFSLREGLARLSALGIISIKQGKGAFLCSDVKSQTLRDVLIPMYTTTSVKQFSDLIEARILLETTLAQKAAQNRTEEDIKELRDNLDKAAQAFDDHEKFAALDYEFHQIIGRIAQNDFLMKMQEMLHFTVIEFIIENVKDNATRKKAFKDHEIIFEDIRKKAAGRVKKNVETHINVCVKNFEKNKKYVEN